MASSKEVYRSYSRFYDDYTDDVVWDLPLYQRLCRPGDRILEIGCGTGRILAALSHLTVTLIGADISPEMLAIARQKLRSDLDSGRLRLLEHDFSRKPLDETYHQVWISYFTFNYILSDPETFLKNASAGLLPGGRLVMDLFVPDSLVDPGIDGVSRQFDPFPSQGRLYAVTDRRCFDGTFERRQVVFDDGQGDRVEMDTTRRYYSLEELKAILKALGFHRIRSFPGYSPEAPSPHNFILMAEKRDVL